MLEKEAESLKITRNRLADKVPSQNDNRDINGMILLFPMEPHRTNGGMISGQNNNHEDQQCTPPNNKLTNVVSQESVWKITAAGTTIQPTFLPHKK